MNAPSGALDRQYHTTASAGLPGPLVAVIVTRLPGTALVALTASVGPVTASVAEHDVPPPGDGVTTVIACVPPDTRSVGSSSAANDVAETNVVVRDVPSTCTTDVPTKFVPVTLSVNAGPPEAIVVGLTL